MLQSECCHTPIQFSQKTNTVQATLQQNARESEGLGRIPGYLDANLTMRKPARPCDGCPTRFRALRTRDRGWTVSRRVASSRGIRAGVLLFIFISTEYYIVSLAALEEDEDRGRLVTGGGQ